MSTPLANTAKKKRGFNEAEYETLLNALPHPILLIAPDHRISYAKP